MRYRKHTADGYLVVSIEMRCRCRNGEVLAGSLRFMQSTPRPQIAEHVRLMRAEMHQEMTTHERTP